MADPDIVADDHAVRMAVREEGGVALALLAVIIRAIGEAVQRGTIDRVVRRADPHAGGDGTEAPDLCVGHDAVRAEIGKISDCRVLDMRALQDFAMLADGGRALRDAGLDNRFRDLWPFHFHLWGSLG